MDIFRGFVRKPEDWCEGPLERLVIHRPTHSIFEYYARPDKPRDAFLEFHDFHARLVHVCDEHPYPNAAELSVLCREAVAVGLFYLGLGGPLDDGDPGCLPS